MNTISWHIEQLQCYPEVGDYVDVVFSVTWRVDGALDSYTASMSGNQPVKPYTADTPFTPYADLQEAQVIGWVQEAMGDSQVAAINASIAAQLKAQITPTVVTPPLPWATV